jgi:lipoprotein-anchoring transpeptidase ErfK/SrfK
VEGSPPKSLEFAEGLAPKQSRFSSRTRTFLITLCVLLPVGPILAGVILLGSSNTHAPAGALLRPLPTAFPTAPLPTAVKVHHHRPGVLVALVRRATTMATSANGPALAPQPVKTTFGSPTVLLVRKMEHGWVGVVSPLAGNGHLGWIRASDVSLTRVDWTIKVSLAQRALTVLRGRKVMERYVIAIGRPAAPTPTGEFAVTDRLETGDPEGPYGCCIIALSALAPHAIQDWDGGDRIAIHSTPPDTYSSIGQPISHGCMHVTLPEGQWLVDHVPLGTPVIVRA